MGFEACWATSSWASHRALMWGLAASRPSATTASVGATAPALMSSQACSVAPASTIMMATSPDSRTRPATTIWKVARCCSE